MMDYTTKDEIKQNRGVFVRNRGMALTGGGFLDRCALPGIIGRKTDRIKKRFFLLYLFHSKVVTVVDFS